MIQAQYQDAVRRQIANLYKAFVDLQSARKSYLSAREAVREQERLAAQLRVRRKTGDEEPRRLTVEFEKTRTALAARSVIRAGVPAPPEALTGHAPGSA